MTASTVRAIHEAANPQSWKLHLTSTPKEMGNAKRKSTAARAILFLLNLFIGTPDRASRCHHTVDSITSRCRRIVAATPAATAHTAGSTHASCAPMNRTHRESGRRQSRGRQEQSRTNEVHRESRCGVAFQQPYCKHHQPARRHGLEVASDARAPLGAWRGAPGAGGNKRSSPERAQGANRPTTLRST